MTCVGQDRDNAVVLQPRDEERVVSKVTKHASFQREHSFPIFMVSPERRGVRTA